MKTLTDNEWPQAFEAYLKRRFPDRSTSKHYVSDLRIFLQHYSGSLTDVTAHDVDTFVDRERARGMSSATVKRRAAALKIFFDFLAEELGKTNRSNPVSMRRHAGRQPEHLPRDLSDAEVKHFLGIVDAIRDQAMIAMMLYAGLRVGEVVDLRPVDITVPDDVKASIRLRVLGKGRKERIVYLCREAYPPVAAYLKEQAGSDPQQPLFRNWRGEPITVNGVQYLMSQYASESGVAVTCHRLRHTFGRRMAEREMPVLTLSRLLGHASPNTTQRYIDGADPQTRRSYEAAMARSLSSESKPQAGECPAWEIEITGPVKVTREPPETFCRNGWMPDAPAWLRTSCLDWIEHKWYTWKPSRRQHHVRTCLGDIRRFWEWQLARRTFASWKELTSADVAAFADAQLGRGLKAKTVRTALDRAFGVLLFLKERGQLSEIPERPGVKLPDPLPQHLKTGEVLALEKHVTQLERTASPETWLDIALYVLLMHAGLRIGEALDLRVRDLDLIARRILVREGKGRRDRVVYLTQKGAERLTSYLQTVSHAAGDLVLSWQEKALNYNRAWRQVRRLGKAAGVERVSPQRLRHTYATLLLNNGMSLEGLRRLMGHENINTTLIYGRLADGVIEQQYHAAMRSVTNG